MMGAILGFFGASPARLQALLIGALVMALTCAGLTTWALIERSGRYQAERDAAIYQSQAAVLADKLDTQNAGVEAARAAGDAAQAATRELLAAARHTASANASLLVDIRERLSRPTPRRADGTAMDCGDAWREIEAKAKAGRP